MNNCFPDCVPLPWSKTWVSGSDIRKYPSDVAVSVERDLPLAKPVQVPDLINHVRRPLQVHGSQIMGHRGPRFGDRVPGRLSRAPRTPYLVDGNRKAYQNADQ